jgi:hypothetical protein
MNDSFSEKSIAVERGAHNFHFLVQGSSGPIFPSFFERATAGRQIVYQLSLLTAGRNAFH